MYTSNLSYAPLSWYSYTILSRNWSRWACSMKFKGQSAPHNLGFKHRFNDLLIVVHSVLSEKTINYCLRELQAYFFYLRSDEIPASDNLEKNSFKYTKDSELSFRASTNCFIRHYFICNGDNIFLWSTTGTPYLKLDSIRLYTLLVMYWIGSTIP